MRKDRFGNPKPRASGRCEACHEPQSSLAYIDGDDTNWAPGNVLTLCRRCRGWLANSFVLPRSRAQALDRLQARYAQTRTQMELPP